MARLSRRCCACGSRATAQAWRTSLEPQPRLAGIELGGTKAIAVLADGERIVAQETTPTGSPDSTLATLNEILRGWDREQKLDALGIASFGPLQLDRERPAFATILSTPKPGWSGAPVASRIAQGLDCPWRIETDVNGAALAEYRWGAGRGCESVCYVTIGTGVGGGLLLGGRPVHGAMHPEIGHLRLRRAPGDGFAGLCPFHADCIEGLVSGPALAARFAMGAEAIPDNHPLWQTVAADLTELACALLLTHSAQRILFGGSVSLSRGFLLPLVRKGVVAQLGTYLPFLDPAQAIQAIRMAELGSQAGPLGAIAVALEALAGERRSTDR